MSILNKYVNINYTTLYYIIVLLILITNYYLGIQIKLKIKDYKYLFIGIYFVVNKTIDNHILF